MFLPSLLISLMRPFLSLKKNNNADLELLIGVAYCSQTLGAE